MNLAQTREYIAAEMTSRLDNVNVFPRRPNVVRMREGWLVLRSVTPETFQTCQATFDVVIVVGSDDQAAEESMDTLAVSLVDVVTDLGASTGVTPLTLLIDGGEVFAVAANLTIETE